MNKKGLFFSINNGLFVPPPRQHDLSQSYSHNSNQMEQTIRQSIHLLDSLVMFVYCLCITSSGATGSYEPSLASKMTQGSLTSTVCHVPAGI